MEFLDHLEELRVRLIRMVVYVVVAAIVCIAIAGGSIVDLATRPILKALPEAGGEMLITRPFEAMVTWLKVDALAGLIIAMPFVGYELWGFIAPALSRRERRLASTIVLACPVLFVAGALFIYFVFPLALRFLISFAAFFPNTKVMLNPKETIGMMLTLMLGMGLVFQTPVVIAALAKLGVVSAKGLLSVWRYAIVVIITVAAILTPTWDPVNLGIVAGPMVALYFCSAGIAALIERSDRKREERRRQREAELELLAQSEAQAMLELDEPAECVDGLSGDDPSDGDPPGNQDASEDDTRAGSSTGAASPPVEPDPSVDHPSTD